MIKRMLFPFLKRFIGLFISMAFVALLSISLLSAFGSMIVNLKSTYTTYLNDYGNVDEQISTKFALRENLEAAKTIEGVEKLDTRLTIDTFLKKSNNRTIVSRVFSYNEKNNTVFSRYVLSSVEKSTDLINVSICRKFANNNNFKLGDTIKLGYFNVFFDFYVSEIIETPEGIYPRANDYVWSDNRDFGYIYVDEEELGQAIDKYSKVIKEMIDSDPSYKEYYEEAISQIGITVPDFREIDSTYVYKYANQVLVQNKAGYTNGQEIADKISALYESKGVKLKSATLGQNLPYRIYMNNAIRQLSIASIFLPVFFYSVTMVVIGLFMNQIIKSMTPQIGIFMSLGISKKEIISLFLIFGLLMSIFSGILGVPTGFGIYALMVNIMKTTYSLPILTLGLNFWACFLSVIILIIFALGTTLLSCLAIFKITPKDAVISNEAKRKKIPHWVDRLIEKAPMNIKLGVNGIAQNPRRFFVSVFSMFASMTIIFLALSFFVSKTEMINQSVGRRMNYDCQVYLTSQTDENSISQLESQEFIARDNEDKPKFEDCYYTYVQTTSEKSKAKVYLECLAIDINHSSMINIPSANGKATIDIQEEGIILPKASADTLKVKKGDYITINKTQVKVNDISYQYFHPITYLSKTQLAKFTSLYVSTFLIDVANEEEFLDYMSANFQQCLTVFTSSLAADLNAIFDAINVFIYIIIGFSLGMSFIILSIMSQNSLMDQQRQISVLRAIGFRIINISNIWTLQSVLQLVFATIFATPFGIGASMLLFHMCSAAAQTYPFVFSWVVLGITFGFVLLVVVVSHWISMFSIKKWNIANNTRSRE